MAKRRKIETQKLQVAAERRGQLHYVTVYSAPEAAREATKLARKGWKVEVQRWHSGRVQMTCQPGSKRDRVYALCDIRPAFKKQIRGR